MHREGISEGRAICRVIEVEQGPDADAVEMRVEAQAAPDELEAKPLCAVKRTPHVVSQSVSQSVSQPVKHSDMCAAVLLLCCVASVSLSGATMRFLSIGQNRSTFRREFSPILDPF